MSPSSALFTKGKLGALTTRNRFVHSATYEAMASATGEVTEALCTRYRKLAKAEVGLLIPGYMFVQPSGKGQPLQTGIHDDEMVPGLRRLVDAAHDSGAPIVFQLAHAGGQTTAECAGRRPMAPSDVIRDPVSLKKPAAMTESDIENTICAFGQAARRAAEAGADGIQIHAAHGYLLSEFLSPYFNQRSDSWGGSNENRFRMLKDTVLTVRKALPPDKVVLVKMNVNDHVPGGGVTPALAAVYCKELAALGVDGVEVSCGSAHHSFMNMVRGDVPVEDLVSRLPLWKRIFGRMLMKRLVGRFDLVEGYNVEGARMVRAALGNVPLLVVGGMRTLGFMERVVSSGAADFVSLCRPFVREPALVKRFHEGKAQSASCASCNRCFAAVANLLPLKCYRDEETVAATP